MRPRKLVPLLVVPVLAVAGALVVVTAAHADGTLRTHAGTRFIGAALATDLLSNNATYRNIAATEFNQVTAENAMKWDATEMNDNQYTFGGADQIVNFATQNNQIVHGHTLVWHSQTPNWVQGLSATAMRTAMQDHISTVVGRYASNPVVQSWDVVNEAFNEDGSRRQSFWQNTLGDGYIADAFRFARAADNNARLCINDFNVEGMNAKSNGLFNLVQSLRAQNVPVDCVGFQGHLGTQFSFPNQVQANIQRFANLGVMVRITELDVRSILPMDATKTQTQITYYNNVINACAAVSACAGVTIWGIDDGHSWVPGTFPGEGSALLWDASFNRKSVYDAVHATLDALDGGGDTQAPSVPGTPTAGTLTSTSITINWTASTDNVGVTGYDIFRAPGTTGGTFASVGTSTTNSFTNTGLTAGQTFRYQVRARDAANNMSAFSASSAPITTPTGGDTQAPTVPGTPAAGTITSSSIAISWTASTDNVGVTGYDIFRAPGTSGGTFASVGTSTTNSFTNSGLSANQTFRYQVRARDAAGNLSAFSASSAPITTSGGTGGACSATPMTQNVWDTGYVINPVTITNTSTSTIPSWTLTVTLPVGHAYVGSWNATVTTSGTPSTGVTITARSISWNSVLAPGASTASFGFQASRPSGNTAVPSAYTCASP